VPEALFFFWVIVGVLAVAAGANHGWHHARPGHLATRLERASHRGGDGASLLVEVTVGAVDGESSPRG
jgi:hypothetical protein